MPVPRPAGRGIGGSRPQEAHQAESNAKGAEERRGGAVTTSSPTRSPDRRPVHQESGEGIGLSIVKRLCELLEASVELESKPEEGTTFRVILPAPLSGH